jgi:hypothetical protein
MVDERGHEPTGRNIMEAELFEQSLEGANARCRFEVESTGLGEQRSQPTLAKLQLASALRGIDARSRGLAIWAGYLDQRDRRMSVKTAG